MRKPYKILLISSLSLLLIASILFVSYFASYRKKAVMKLGSYKLSEDVYEFYLSIYKQNILSSYKGAEDTAEFFSQENENGVTYEEYFQSLADYYIKQKLAAVALFDALELKLSDKAKQEIEENVKEVIYYVTNGKEEDFDKIAGKYGIDKKGYKNATIIDYKLSYLYEILYSSGTSGVDEEGLEKFFNQNYSHVKIVLIRTDYDFEREDGDPSTPKTDANGNYIKNYYTDTESQAAKNKIADMKAQIDNGVTDETFNYWWENDNRDFKAGNSPDGYYLSKYSSYDTSVINKAAEMKSGELTYMDFDTYTLFIKKYDNVPGVYNSQEYKDSEWFDSFLSHAAQYDFADLLDSYASETVINEKVKAKYKISEIKANKDF